MPGFGSSRSPCRGCESRAQFSGAINPVHVPGAQGRSSRRARLSFGYRFRSSTTATISPGTRTTVFVCWQARPGRVASRENTMETIVWLSSTATWSSPVPEFHLRGGAFSQHLDLGTTDGFVTAKIAHLIPSMNIDRLRSANAALQTFAPETRIERRRGGWWVCWTNYRGEQLSRRWMTRGQDFYPVWSHLWGHGGTCCTALSQLVRWSAGRPVLPLASWLYWTGPVVKLARDKGQDLVDTLRSGGYPEHVPCVLCGDIVTKMDWWSLDGVSGPCCAWTTGCRQKVG